MKRFLSVLAALAFALCLPAFAQVGSVEQLTLSYQPSASLTTGLTSQERDYIVTLAAGATTCPALNTLQASQLDASTAAVGTWALEAPPIPLAYNNGAVTSTSFDVKWSTSYCIAVTEQVTGMVESAPSGIYLVVVPAEPAITATAGLLTITAAPSAVTATKQ